MQTKIEDWNPKEGFEIEGTEVIAWLSTDKGFVDTTANLYFGDGVWRWGDSGDKVKRQDLIMGVMPWPDAPVKYSNK